MYKKSTSTSTPIGRRISNSSTTSQAKEAPPALNSESGPGGYEQIIREPSLVDMRNTSRQGASEDEDYFGPQKIQDRMRKYAQGAGFPMEFLDRYSEEVKTRK